MCVDTRGDDPVADPTDYALINDETRRLLGSSCDALRYFADMLIDEGELRGLIGTKELPRLWSRHIVNSACIVPLISRRARKLADVGSGAGFPGIVIAAMRPDLEVTLIESMEKRCVWLDIVRQELDLDNVRIFHGRCEKLPRSDRFDVVTSRAVASLVKLVPLSARLVRGGGQYLALKGQSVHDEITAAKDVLQRAGLVDVKVHEVLSPMDASVTRVFEAVKKKG